MNKSCIEEIEELLREEYGIENLQPSDNIKKDLGLTSFDFANLLCILEDKFDIEIDEGKYRELDTVGDFYRYIEEITEKD